jgi:hypothetical protein
MTEGGLDSETQSHSADKPARLGQPEFGARDAQAGKGQIHLAQMRSTALAGVRNQPIACRSALLAHQMHQKGVGSAQQTKQFEAGFPVVNPQALDGHFALQVAERQLDLPSARIGQHHFPGLFSRGDHLVGE